MKKIFSAVLALAAIAACNQVSKTTVITADFGEDAPEAVMVQIPELGIDTLVAVTDGKFSLEVPTNVLTSGVVNTGLQMGQFIPDGTTITAEPDGRYLKFTSNKPSKSVNARMDAFQEWMDDFSDRYDEAESEEAQEALFDEYIEKLKETAKKNPDNIMGIFAIQGLQGQIDAPELKEIISGLSPEAREHQAISRMLESLDAAVATAEGNMFTDFEAEQPDGSVKKLSDYVGQGKYVLVDFWASWCGPCRREIPNIKAVYEKYAGEKFDVLSVAVWDKPEDTAEALAEEQLPWNQIVNAQRIPTDIYGIEGIPHLILFGPDGTIVKRGEGLRGANMDPVIGSYLQ